MKLFTLFLLISPLLSCQKSIDTDPVISYPITQPPTYGLWLMVDTANFIYPPDQVSYSVSRELNLDFSTQLQRPIAHTVEFHASNNNPSRIQDFLMDLNVVDLVEGSYMMNKTWETYPYSYISNYRQKYLEEPYWGNWSYTDTTGTYSGELLVNFTKIDSSTCSGNFSGVITNVFTEQSKYLQGSFYKENL
jgi:hypothetical protein